MRLKISLISREAIRENTFWLSLQRAHFPSLHTATITVPMQDVRRGDVMMFEQGCIYVQVKEFSFISHLVCVSSVCILITVHTEQALTQCGEK